MAQAKPELVRLSVATWIGLGAVLGVPFAGAYITHDRKITKLEAENEALTGRVSQLESLVIGPRSTP